MFKISTLVLIFLSSSVYCSDQHEFFKKMLGTPAKGYATLKKKFNEAADDISLKNFTRGSEDCIRIDQFKERFQEIEVGRICHGHVISSYPYSDNPDYIDPFNYTLKFKKNEIYQEQKKWLKDYYDGVMTYLYDELTTYRKNGNYILIKYEVWDRIKKEKDKTWIEYSICESRYDEY
jgi:hypothetical protein